MSSRLLGPVLAAICFQFAHPGNGQLHPGSAVRATPGTSEPALKAPHPRPFPGGQAGHVQQFPGGQGCTDSNATVDTDDLCIAGGGIGLGSTAKLMCHRSARSLVIRYDFAPGGTARDHRNTSSDLRHPHFADVTAETTHIAGLDSNNPKSLVPPGLAPRWQPSWIVRIKERSHRVGEVPQRLLLHHLASCRKPGILESRCSELPTLFQVAWRARPPGCQCLCCSTARFHTYRAWAQWSRSAIAWLAVGYRRYRDMRTQYRMLVTFLRR